MCPGELFPAALAARERAGAHLAQVVAVVPDSGRRFGAALGRQSEHVAVERPGERISHRNLLG
jgi:hypothetical protein